MPEPRCLLTKVTSSRRRSSREVIDLGLVGRHDEALDPVDKAHQHHILPLHVSPYERDVVLSGLLVQ